MKKRVLVVDDDPAITKLFKAALQDTDEFDVREENNGRFAISTADEFHPDLIFLDRHLPGVDGEKILAALRSSQHLDGVPIVIITGASKAGEKPAEDTGAPWLYKPFFHGALLNCARRMLSAAASNS